MNHCLRDCQESVNCLKVKRFDVIKLVIQFCYKSANSIWWYVRGKSVKIQLTWLRKQALAVRTLLPFLSLVFSFCIQSWWYHSLQWQPSFQCNLRVGSLYSTRIPRTQPAECWMSPVGTRLSVLGLWGNKAINFLEWYYELAAHIWLLTLCVWKGCVSICCGMAL